MPETACITPDKQIVNRNYAYPTKYRFTVARAPKTVFFANSASVPGIEIPLATQNTGLGRDIPHPGNKLRMDNFELRFIVDEDLTNYIEINRWIRGMSFPQSLQQIYDLQDTDRVDYTKYNSGINIYSDGTLQILNSNDRVTMQVRYYDMFPFSLTPLVYDATVSKPDPFLATVRFQYTYFEFLDKKGNPV